jgi:hypothetical protein
MLYAPLIVPMSFPVNGGEENEHSSSYYSQPTLNSKNIFLVTVQVHHRFILKKYFSEIDSEGHTEAVFEARIRSNHCLR